uniref:Uncharacterized protein n=1 Tax=Anopheles christyi TaxID=43041 RepID=A0A182KIG5_9DIPT
MGSEWGNRSYSTISILRSNRLSLNTSWKVMVAFQIGFREGVDTSVWATCDSFLEDREVEGVRKKPVSVREIVRADEGYKIEGKVREMKNKTKQKP